MTVDSRVDNLTHWGNMHPFFFVLHRFWGFCSAWYEERGVGGVGGGLLACSWEGKERKGRENVPPPPCQFYHGGGEGVRWLVVCYRVKCCIISYVGSCYGCIEWKLKGCFEKN